MPGTVWLGRRTRVSSVTDGNLCCATETEPFVWTEGDLLSLPIGTSGVSFHKSLSKQREVFSGTAETNRRISHCRTFSDEEDKGRCREGVKELVFDCPGEEVQM